MSRKTTQSAQEKSPQLHCDDVVMTDIAEVVPNPKNPNKHPPTQIKALAKIISIQGWRAPIVVSNRSGFVVAGHGRLEAAHLLGLDAVPVSRQDFETEAAEYSHMLADNRIAELADLEMDEVGALLKDLSEQDDFDIDLTGYDESFLSQLLDGDADGSIDAEPQTDKADELAEKWGTKRGQIWKLGNHRLMCGDSTSEEDVKRLLGGVEPHLMVTDPPYGVNYDPEWRSDPKAGGKGKADQRAKGKVENDDKADWREAWALFPGDVVYVWHAGIFSNIVAESLIACSFKMRALIVWGKSNYPMGRGNYHHQHEPCWYAVREKRTGHWVGDRKQTTLWKIDSPRKSETGHSTQKPIECMRRPMENNSSRGQAVYEPFCGSGTSIIAAEQIGRVCYAMEISPQYVAVIIQRFMDATGIEPEIIDAG